MPTEAEAVAAVNRLLRGRYDLSEDAQTRTITSLGDPERAILREIAAGTREPQHPRIRLHAVAALGFDQEDPHGARAILADLIASDEEPAPFRIGALRALKRLGPGPQSDAVRALVMDASVRPDVALAAARTAASIAEREVAAEIQALHDRLLPLVPDAESPSLRSLRHLAHVADGDGERRHDRGGRRDP